MMKVSIIWPYLSYKALIKLFTELPRRVVVATSLAYTPVPDRYASVCKRSFASSPNLREEFFSETGFPTLDILGNPGHKKSRGC
jgi:hypothetical protein